MKVLYISTVSHDLASIFLYAGFCELIGKQNVILAEHYPYLANNDGGPSGRILCGADSASVILCMSDPGSFNLVVLHSSFLRDHGWNWAADLIRRYLAPNGVVAYIEGWDGTEEIFAPPPILPITRVFRREIDPGVSYPYHATPLQWACPEWWLDEPREPKVIDVSCLCSPQTVALRWPIMSRLFQTRTRYISVVGGGIHFDQYLWVTKRSKWVIVPPGGGSDCVRQWEAIGAGAIPIFVGHTRRVRDPWFSNDEVFECDVDGLPALLDHILSNVDWPAMQARLEQRVRKEHTTRARARRVVELTGVVDG